MDKKVFILSGMPASGKDTVSDMIYEMDKKKNMNRLRTLISIALLFCSVTLMAQNTMRIHYKDGSEQDISISEVDSVTFVEKKAPEAPVSLTGEWLWAGKEEGYYELLSFSDDQTYTGYDKYFTYGFDTMTYGWYNRYGNMLTLQSNGYGYRRLYNWFIIGLTDNALEVMTKMGPFIYYKLQSETLYLSQSEIYRGFADADSVVFADDVIVKAEGSKLQGVVPGTTYVLVKKAVEDKIYAYKVVVK